MFFPFFNYSDIEMVSKAMERKIIILWTEIRGNPLTKTHDL